VSRVCNFAAILYIDFRVYVMLFFPVIMIFCFYFSMYSAKYVHCNECGCFLKLLLLSLSLSLSLYVRAILWVSSYEINIPTFRSVI